MNCFFYILKRVFESQLFVALAAVYLGFQLYKRQKSIDRHSDSIQKITEKAENLINEASEAIFILIRIDNSIRRFGPEAKNEADLKELKDETQKELNRLAGIVHDTLQKRSIELKTSVEISEFFREPIKNKVNNIQLALGKFTNIFNQLLIKPGPGTTEIIKQLEVPMKEIISEAKKLISEFKN